MNKNRIPFILIILFGCFSLTAQLPYIEWARCYGGSKNEKVAKIRQTSDLGYIVVGTTSSTDGDVQGNINKESIWVLKLGVYGNIEWQRIIRTSIEFDQDIGISIIQCLDSGFMVLGNTRFANFPQNKVYKNAIRLTKLTPTGDIEWNKTYSDAGERISADVIQAKDSNYLVVGSKFSTSYDGIIWMIDAKGNVLKNGLWGGRDEDILNSIIQKSDGGFCLLGSGNSKDGDLTGSTSSSYDYWLIEFEDSLKKKSSKHYGGCGNQYPRSFKQTTNGNYITVGTTYNDTCSNDTNFVQGNHGGIDGWIILTDSVLNLKWQRSVGGSGTDYLNEMGTTKDHGFVFCGYSNSADGDIKSNHGSYDAIVIKMDSLSNILWQKSLGGTSDDGVNSIQQTLDGGFIVGGNTNSVDMDINGNHGGNDFWVVKLSAGGVGVKAVTSNLDFRVNPNPTKDFMELHVSFNEVGKCYFIQDCLGKVLIKGIIANEITDVDLTKIPKGIYFIGIEGENSNGFKLIKL